MGLLTALQTVHGQPEGHHLTIIYRMHALFLNILLIYYDPNTASFSTFKQVLKKLSSVRL